MIVDKSSDGVDPQQPLAGPSRSAGLQPPSFEESTRDQALPSYSDQFPESSEVYVPQGGEAPPPEFTPYEAEYFVSGGAGDIVSHDRHLNEDGEALYRFLLSHSQTPPTLVLHVHGDHTESRTRWVSRRDNDGNHRTEPEYYTEEVVDFDFSIDVGQHIAAGPVHWSLPDNEPAYRGKMYKEVDDHLSLQLEGDMLLGLTRRHSTRRETKLAKASQAERASKGLPPWATLQLGSNRNDSSNLPIGAQQAQVLKSSRTLRQWADEYCASDKLLKEFTYEKTVCGWNFANLETAVNAAIKSTYFSGRVTVEFKLTNAQIHVRPDNGLSRTLSNKWLKVLLCVLLIFPFIWLYRRFGRRGGGRWEVCGGAYFLKSWQPVDPDAPPPPFPGDGRTVHTQAGNARLVGMREGVWFQRWEGTIRRAVTGRLISTTPLKEPDDGPLHAAFILDGYPAVMHH
ncbi:hypothetical protein BKA93DRAFT_756836 [Sparassis latifolia]